MASPLQLFISLMLMTEHEIAQLGW